MKKLMLVIFLSCGIAWMLLNHLYWKKANPKHFVKSAHEVELIHQASASN